MARVIWIYGLSASGKTTKAKELKGLFDDFIVLDGDEFRINMGGDLGFTMEHRWLNIKRATFVIKLLVHNGISVIAAFTTPLKAMREHIKQELGDKVRFIYMNTALEICVKRDPKGLYKKAFNGKIKNMVGVDIPFEV
jgi:adenylylsulfate kinase-like enzyme